MRKDCLTRRDGAPAMFGIVEMKGAASVLAIASEGEVLLVREFKGAAGRETLAVTSGAIAVC